MSYLLLGIDDVKTLVKARDICQMYSQANPLAKAAHENLLGVLRFVALDPNANVTALPIAEDDDAALA